VLTELISPKCKRENNRIYSIKGGCWSFYYRGMKRAVNRIVGVYRSTFLPALIWLGLPNHALAKSLLSRFFSWDVVDVGLYRHLGISDLFKNQTFTEIVFRFFF
jgi:hypothetical protein